MFLMFKCVFYGFCHINRYPIPTVCRTKMSFSCDNLLSLIVFWSCTHIHIPRHTLPIAWTPIQLSGTYGFLVMSGIESTPRTEDKMNPKMCGIKFFQQMHNIKSIVLTFKNFQIDIFFFLFLSSVILSHRLNLTYGPLLIACCLRFIIIMVWFTQLVWISSIN